MITKRHNGQGRLVGSLIAWLLFIPLLISAAYAAATTHIEVRGVGFYWHFLLPGKDGRLGTEDDLLRERELILEVGTPVVFHLRSDDYLYMFRSDELGLKELAAPGLEFSLTFTPQISGRFALEVDPMCGFNLLHDNEFMGHLKIVDRRDP